MNPRVPWRIQAFFYAVFQHASSLLSRASVKKSTKPDISFFCNYQQTTGATVAIACIANQLSRYFNVDAHIKPLSGYSKLLKLRVRQIFSPQQLSGDIVFVDIQRDSQSVSRLVSDNKTVILTCHAFPTTLHSVPQDKLVTNLELSSYIHFVSEHQRSEFIQHYPAIDIQNKSFAIPNYTRKCTKSKHTGNVGIVGLLNREPKNALKGIKLGQASNARTIECWGSCNIHGLNNPEEFPKLRISGWTYNTQKIFNSFDVLISTSNSETFALVVAEALSAGIPCLLSDIPVYRELYSDCEGVILMTGDDVEDIASIDHLLENADSLKSNIVDFWGKHFSSKTIDKAWISKIREINE